MNRFTGTGRLTAKPELRYTTSNIAFARFTLAVNRPKQKDKEQETDFIECRVWRGQAENLVKYQDKGSLIAVEGRLTVDNYQDKEGNNRHFTYVLVDNIEYLQSKPKTKTQESVQQNTQVNDPFAEFGEQISIDDNFLD